MPGSLRRNRDDYIQEATRLLDTVRTNSMPPQMKSMLISEANAYIELAKLTPDYAVSPTVPQSTVVPGAPIVTEAPTDGTTP